MNHQKAKTPNGKASNGKASTAPAQPTVKNAPAVPPSKTASQPAKTGPPPVKSAPAIPPAKTAPLPVKPPPLFRRTDWLSFLITFLAVLIGYYLTLAPELAARITDYRRIIDFRNLLSHGYDLVDTTIVWDIVQSDVPVLHREVEELLASLGGLDESSR